MAGPGAAKTGGRQVGTPNRITKALKDMILGALDDAGGQEYLREQARENPAAFMTLLGKVLPTTLAGEAKNPLVVGVPSLSDEQLAERVLRGLVDTGIPEDAARRLVGARLGRIEMVPVEPERREG